MIDVKRNDINVGPTVITDSSYEGAFRANEDGALVTDGYHPRFGELGVRRQVFSVATATAGTTVVAGNVAPPGAAAATVLTVLNPVGSGMNLEILQGWIYIISTTAGAPGAGFWAWCGAMAGVSIAGVLEAGIKRPCQVGQDTPRFRAYTQAALTGGPAHSIVRPFPTSYFAGIVAQTTWGKAYITDEVDGAIVVPPGCILTLAPAAVGTAVIVGAGMMLAQVPLPEFG